MIYVIALRQAARTCDRWQVLPRAYYSVCEALADARRARLRFPLLSAQTDSRKATGHLSMVAPTRPVSCRPAEKSLQPRAAGFSLRSNPGLHTPPRPSLSFFGRLYRES